jgi:hypothetical protein
MKQFEETLESILPIFGTIEVSVCFTALTHKRIGLCNQIIEILGLGKFLDHVAYLNLQLGENTFVVTYTGGYVSDIAIPKRKDIPTANDWIEEYRDLYPKGVFTATRSVKGDKQGCLKKMNTFLKQNPEATKEQIIAATTLYIQKSKANGFDRMTCADYFIEKNGVSMLSSYLEMIAEGKDNKPYSNLREL